MVKKASTQFGKGLRWTQIAHSVLLPPFLIFAALSDSFLIRLESGETVDIAAYHGLLGDTLLWVTILILCAQAISLWRLSSLAIVIYAWCGTWLLLIAIAIASSAEVLTEPIEELATAGRWIVDALELDFEFQNATVELGNAWMYLLLAALSMIFISIWMFIRRYQVFLEKRLGLGK